MGNAATKKSTEMLISKELRFGSVWSGCEDRAAHFRTIQYGQGANMALPIFAEFMKRVYEDTLNTAIYPINFDISKSVYNKLDCGENIQGGVKTEYEEEF